MKSIKFLYNRTSMNSIVEDMVKICLTFFIFFTSLILNAQTAQISKTDNSYGGFIYPLKEGDSIPKELWYHKLRILDSDGNVNETTLNNFRNKKLIVLDFWATWCGTCISSLPTIDTLSRQFNDDIQIFFVSAQDREKITKFLDRKQVNYNFPFVCEENILEGYFPHRYLPHSIVISDNRVLKVLGAEKLNARKINTFLNK